MNNSKGVHEKDMFLVIGNFSGIRVHYDIETPKFGIDISFQLKLISDIFYRDFDIFISFYHFICCLLDYIRILEIR